MKQKLKILSFFLLIAVSGSIFFAPLQIAKADIQIPDTSPEGTFLNPFFEGIITAYVPGTGVCPAFVNVINDSGDDFNFAELPGFQDGYWDVYDITLDPIDNDPGIMIKGSMYPLPIQSLGLYELCPVPIFPMIEAGSSMPPTLGE